MHNACIEVPEVPVVCHTQTFKLLAILKNDLFSTIEGACKFALRI